MSRKSCNRVKHDAAWMTKRKPLANDQLRDLSLAYRLALQAMLRGSGTEETFSTLACSLNIAMVLCEQGVWASYLHGIQEAQDALLSSRDRAQKLNKWGFDGNEARLVMRALAIHDEQLAMATKSQIVSALAEVKNRLTEGEVTV